MRHVFVRDISAKAVLRIGTETDAPAEMRSCQIAFRGSGEEVIAEGSPEDFRLFWREFDQAQMKRERKKWR